MTHARLVLLLVLVAIVVQCDQSPVCVGQDAASDANSIIVDASQGEASVDAPADSPIDGFVDASDGGDPPPNLTCPGPTSSGSLAVNRQINAAHDGSQPNDTLSLPLCRRWSRNLHGNPTSVSVISNRVFATAITGNGGGTLFALDAKTGYDLWGPVTFSTGAEATAAANEVIVVSSGVVKAYDAGSGAGLWSTQLSGQSDYGALVTAGPYILLTGAGGGFTLYVLDAASGSVLWSANYSGSLPSVSSTTVYVAGDALNGFDLQTGTPVWPIKYSTTSPGFAPFIGDRVYVPGATTWDATSRTSLGFNGSDQPPAVFGTSLIESSHGRIMAIPANEVTPTWSFGDGSLVTAPIVVGPAVAVVSTSGMVSVVRGSDGALLSTASAGDTITYQGGFGYDGWLTEADGLLLVATDSRLVAF